MDGNIDHNTNDSGKFARIEDLENIIDSYGTSYAYEFDVTLPNGKTAGKVGDTNAPLRRKMEWTKVYKDWFEVEFDYLGTTDIDKDTFFRDYSIHAYGKQHLGWKQVPREDFPAGEHYTQEAYYGANAENVDEAVRQLREDIREGKATVKLYHRKNEDECVDAPSEPYVPRANQQVCIDNIISAYNSGRHHLLCAAHPRFGKSFTALYAIDKLGEIDFVMVVSAVADAHDEWKDTVNLPNFRNNWVFIDSKKLAGGTGHDIADKINDGKKVVVFCTLQDIEGDEKKAKHAEIYKFAKHNSFLIVDETHNGGRGITFSKKIKQIDGIDTDDALEKEDIEQANEAAVNFGFVNQLHLSGTPYRILLTDEFAPEDIVYMASYSDLLAEKHAWFIEHAGEDERLNPYYEFPERYNFVYDLNQIPDEGFKQFIDEEGLPRLAEIFAVNPDGKFANENLVKSIINGLYGGFVDKGCWGIFAYKAIVKAVKKFHILMKLPSIAACDAFAELISTCDEFKDYAIILATSNKHANPAVKDIKAQVLAADKSDKTAGSITITCQRLSAAVSVKQWNVAINASDGKSAQDYDQFAQRVCTPFAVDFSDSDGDTIKQVEKPNVFVVDLVPERVLSISMQAAVAKCAARGVSSPTDFRAELEKEASNTMTFFVSGIESMKQVTAVDVMDMSANYANSSTIDTAVAKVPFCASLFDGDTARVLASLDGEISAAKSFDTKVYDGADDTDVSDKRKKPEEDADDNKSSDDNFDDADTTDDKNDDMRTLRENEAKQRAFFSRIGYLAVLSSSHRDSLESMLDGFSASAGGEQTVKNVTGLSLSDCRLVADAVNENPRVRMAADNLVYAMSRRMNDENMTIEDKLLVFAKSFSKLGASEVITPAEIAKMMVDELADNLMFDAVGSKSRIVELSAETGEFTIALVNRFKEIGVFVDEIRPVVCAIPASTLAYECTRKVYELLGLDTDNIYRFTAYDLLNAVKSDSGIVDESKISRVSDILKQAKKPCDISLDDVIEEGADKVNIEAIVGNPPYQINVADDSGREQLFPVYHIFIDCAARLSDYSILITPARFLSNAGKTPRDWNVARLNDKHFSVVKYYADSSQVFPNVSVKGGIAITVHDAMNEYEPIVRFIPFTELDSIEKKVSASKSGSIMSICYLQNKFNLDALYADYPNAKQFIGSAGHDKRLRPNAFEKLPFVFHDARQSKDDICIHGLIRNKRVVRYIDKKYIASSDSNLDEYKVLIPSANGSGAIGEVLSTPLIGVPLIGYTQSFISMGAFATQREAESCMKYIKTKFARAMLGILKTTQHNPAATWRFVPLQDFSTSSDIDWSKPVSDIDSQLYSKYDLSDDEIEFIESHIKPMG